MHLLKHLVRKWILADKAQRGKPLTEEYLRYVMQGVCEYVNSTPSELEKFRNIIRSLPSKISALRDTKGKQIFTRNKIGMNKQPGRRFASGSPSSSS